MSVETLEIKVSGMTCGHCEMTVKNAIMALGAGIKDVKVDRNSSNAVVSFDDTVISRSQIVAAINATEIYSAV